LLETLISVIWRSALQWTVELLIRFLRTGTRVYNKYVHTYCTCSEIFR
jgi:hypothetical protein